MSAWKSMIAVALCGLLPGTVTAAGDAEDPQGEARSVSLVYFADLHAQLEPHAELFWHGGHDEMTTAGGVARLAAAIETIRKEQPGRTLVMDAGDTIQGSAAAAWTEGRAVVPPVNALEPDLGLPGNWEVAYGAEALRCTAGAFRHPLIAANLRDAGAGRLLFPPYLVRERNGVRIGVIGYTDPDVPRRQPPSYSWGWPTTAPRCSNRSSRSCGDGRRSISWCC